MDLWSRLQAFEQGVTVPATFDHIAHVQIAYAMSSHYAFDEALMRYARGLRSLAVRAGRPEKFHMTITVAFLAIISERRIRSRTRVWSDFIAANQDLLDRRCLEAWYLDGALESPLARVCFLLPRGHRERLHSDIPERR